MSSILLYAILGGVISAVSTSVGALLTPWMRMGNPTSRLQLSVDFAMGAMLSTVLFSLVGPQVFAAASEPEILRFILTGFAAGLILVGITHRWVQALELKPSFSSTKVVLAVALILHNFPEGMGAGSAMAGLSFDQAIPVQIALSIQNIAEGLLVSLCFLSFGWTLRLAILGGIGSGLVEFTGALIAGLVLQQTLAWLPYFLSIAGGAMLMSVLLEVVANKRQGLGFHTRQFALGLAAVPVMNLIMIVINYF